jgi:tripartite-type tricarboxylate transporter receptor subunit TctC
MPDAIRRPGCAPSQDTAAGPPRPEPSAVPRRALTAAITGLLLPAAAQEPEDRPMRLVVPFAPGGGADLFARVLAPDVARFLGRPVVVENLSGASGNIGTEAVARAAPDGRAVLYTTASVAINPALFRRLPFDTARDLAALNLVCAQPHILVATRASGLRSVAEAIERARRSGAGRVAYASPGAGTSGHLTMEWLARQAGVEFTHVPYRGAGQAVAALLADDAPPLGISVGAVLGGHIREGRLAALATTGPERLAMLPAAPTLTEDGFEGLVTEQWHATFAPVATPERTCERLAEALAAAIGLPGFGARVAEDGGRVINAKGPAVLAFLRAEREKWAELVRLTGARAD